MSASHTEAEHLFFEGTRALSAGDLVHAEQCLRDAIDLVPDFAEAHANLGLVLEKRGGFAEAESLYRRSIECNPHIARTHLNLGALLAAQKRFAAAEATYSYAIALDARSPANWSNLGVLYACMKRESEAEQCYRTAMAIDAQYDLARFNLSYLLLRQGKFGEGWHCFEARDWYAGLARRINCARWQGEPLAGKSLLIGCEAGYGDMIQFGRYASVLKVQGAAHIAMICHAPLKRLFGTLEGIDKILVFEETIADTGFDYWTPLLSIPFHCKTCIESIPAQLPYLHAEPEQKTRWAALMPSNGLRVGLVWKGNPKFENDADRSLASLDVLAPLGAVNGINFISLQKGEGEDEAMHPPAGLSLIPLGSMIDDFADTAAIIENLDLVISVDTAVAHLSGAMGRPCWVLLPDYKTDWRWLEHRSDSPWYPDIMRLFRQTDSAQWHAVIARVQVALAEFAQDRQVPSA